MMTPWPVSTRLIACGYFRRRFSMSSFGPIQTVTIASCGPDNMLHRMHEFLGQTAVSHQNQADHGWRSPLKGGSGQVRGHFIMTGIGGTSCWRPFDLVGGARAQIAMQDRGRKSFGAQGFRHGLGSIDRTVAPASAAETDIDIAFALRLIARKQRQQQVANLGESSLERHVFAGYARRPLRPARSVRAVPGSSADCREIACRTPDRPAAVSRAQSRSWKMMIDISCGAVSANRSRIGLLQLVGGELAWCRSRHRPSAAAAPAIRVPHGCRYAPGGLAPSGGAAVFRCSAAPAHRCCNRETAW